MADQEVLDICQLLNNNAISISHSNSWLLGCIEWFRSENHMYNFQQLQEFVCSQWLLADLNDIQEASLPNTNSTGAIQLTGKYVVQVNWMRDVGQSSYSQLKDLQVPNNKESNENFTLDKPDKWEAKPKRMYMMEITDGVTTLLAMEYRTINKLREPFFPGCKMYITGPVECRKGVLLLEENNVTMLGGEVSSLFEANSTSGILARSLDLEPGTILPSNFGPNDRPINRRNGSIRVSAIPYRDTTPIPHYNVNGNIESDSNLLAMDEDDDLLLQVHTEDFQPENRNMTNVNTSYESEHEPVNNSSTFEQNWLKTSDSNRAPLQAKKDNTTMQGRLNRPKPVNKTLFSFVNKISPNNQLNNASQNDSQSSLSKMPSCTSQQPYESSPSYSPTQPSVSEITSRCTQQSKISSHLTQQPCVSNISQSMQQSSISENADPMVILDDEDDDMFANVEETSEFPYCKQIHGSLESFTSKLKIRNEEWVVTAIISDGKNSFEVGFSSDVLEEIFEISAAEIQAKRAEISTNPAVKERVNLMLKNAQIKLKSLKCMMTVEYTSPIDLPRIIAVDL